MGTIFYINYIFWALQKLLTLECDNGKELDKKVKNDTGQPRGGGSSLETVTG